MTLARLDEGGLALINRGSPSGVTAKPGAPQLFAARQEALQRILRACRSSSKRGAVVAGAPGLGKTLLVRAAADTWNSDEVVWITANAPARSIAFAAFSGIAGSLDSTDFSTWACAVIKGLRGSTLLVVDDAHLLDPASATLMLRLAQEPRHVALLVAGSVDPTTSEVLRPLWRDDRFERVDLVPLDGDAMREAVGQLLGGQVEQATMDRLAALSSGNPFILAELTTIARAGGVLGLRNGQWSWLGDIPRSRALQQLVEWRLRGVDPRARRVAEVASVAGPLGLAEVAAIIDHEAVAAAEETGLISVEPDESRLVITIVDRGLSEVIRASMGHGRRVEIGLALARAFEQHPLRRSRDDLLRAQVRLESHQEHPDDDEVFTRASRLARPDYERAERFARAALRRGAGFTAFDYLVDALLWQGQIAEAQQLVREHDSDLTRAQRDYFELRWTRMLWWMTGERPEQPAPVRDSEEALPSTEDAPGSMARRVAMTAADGLGTEVVGTALEILADPEADDEARCWAAGAALIGLGGQGRVESGLSLLQDAYVCAERIADFNYRLLLSVLDVWVRRLSGDLDGARQTVTKVRVELDQSVTANAGLVDLMDAELELATGQARSAVPMLRAAAARLDLNDFGGLSAMAHFRLAEAFGLLGDTVAAGLELEAGSRSDDRTLGLFRPELRLAKAWAAIAAGDRKQALAHLNDGIRLAEDQGQSLVAVHLHLTEIRMGIRSAYGRLDTTAAEVEGPFASACGTLARSLRAEDLPGIVSAAQAFEDLGMLVHAADALALAISAARRLGDHRSAQNVSMSVSALISEVGEVETPALRRSGAIRSPLTRRQREVAQLAADGLSNRAIAEQLGIGIRTVESHLDATYRQLGVRKRADLTALAPGLINVMHDEAEPTIP